MKKWRKHTVWVNMKINYSLPPSLSKIELQRLLEEKPITQRNKEKLNKHSLNLVVQVAKRYRSHEDLGVLCSVGSVGLVKAVNNLEGVTDSNFTEHLSRYINEEVLIYINKRK